MWEFDECLRLTRKIKDKEDKIIELKSAAMSPKNQDLNGMPKGGGVQESLQDRYLFRLEKLESQKDKLCAERSELWKIAKSKLKKVGITQESTIQLFKYRFMSGYSWERCCKKVQDKFANEKWNINKCFRVYGGTLYKLRQKNL